MGEMVSGVQPESQSFKKEKMILFETKRTYVRPMNIEDLEPFCELETNPNVVKYTGYPNARNLDEAKKDLYFIFENYEMTPPEKLIYSVINKSTEELVGTVALLPYAGTTWEIGYRFLERHWGKGYASELVPALIQYGLSQPQIEKIYAEADVRNTASIIILERLMEFQDEVWNEKLGCRDRQYIRGRKGVRT